LLSKLLNVPIIIGTPTREHFCGDKEPIILEAIDTFIKNLDSSVASLSQNDDRIFIQTPNSLRLDSKKYADEAEQFQQRLTEKKPDFLVVIAYGKIIPQHILDIPKF
jgi:hypothetical protein